MTLLKLIINFDSAKNLHFAVLPITMAGSYYAFTMAKAALRGSFTVYFLPVDADAVINIDTVTKTNQERDTLTIRVWFYFQDLAKEVRNLLSLDADQALGMRPHVPQMQNKYGPKMEQ